MAIYLLSPSEGADAHEGEAVAVDSQNVSVRFGFVIPSTGKEGASIEYRDAANGLVKRADGRGVTPALLNIASREFFTNQKGYIDLTRENVSDIRAAYLMDEHKPG